MMAMVAHQRALAALRVVVLPLRKAVVDDQQRATRHAPADILDQRFGGRIDFADKVAGHREPLRRGRAQRFVEERPVLPRQRDAASHAAFQPLSVAPDDQMRGYGVEHLVHHDGAVDRGGQRVEPFDTRRVVWRDARNAQVGADLEDRVAGRQRIELRERIQHVGGERATARAEFDDLARHRCREYRRDLRGHRLRVQLCRFRRRDEIAVGAELARAGNVIAQAGRVQHDLHVARERNPATGSRNLRADGFHDARAVLAFGGWGLRQGRDRMGRHRSLRRRHPSGRAARVPCARLP